MTIGLMFNDAVRVPAEVAGLAGISRFGRLLYKRRRLAERLLAAAEASGIEHVVEVRSVQDLEALRDRMTQRPSARRYLYWPSNVVARVEDAKLQHFLAKLEFADRNLRVDVGSAETWTGLALLEGELLPEFIGALVEGNVGAFMAAHNSTFASIENTVGLVDLCGYPAFLEYLTSNFEVRHFNSILPGDPYTLLKRSHDKEKIRAEFRYFEAIPDPLRRFFVQPFQFEEDTEAASYRMERLLVPDMAMQWVHGSLAAEEFASFLDRLFDYVSHRPARKVSIAEAQARADALYLTKVDERLAQLKALPVFAPLDALLACCPGGSGVTGLVARYKALYTRLGRTREYGPLALGHGDLCFSNILYGKSAQIMKFIDPRGAADGADLYSDPYYDVAKLSHSALGLYDYLNYGLFTVAVSGGLVPELQCESADRNAEQEMFRARLEGHGFDYRLTRLYEASLFLSMLPLHADGPRKLAAFALTAQAILDELEA